ncbi:hypothetical protein [Streptomyces sp. 4F14]|uniref:hypothetical protein n=1 Tax=Streptomyces sp. 4F14 TaxID=3394380 RepID=UPI003A83A02E
MVSPLFSVTFGSWIMRIIEQSAGRAELIVELDADPAGARRVRGRRPVRLSGGATNSRRHAGSSARARVRPVYRDAFLTLSVREGLRARLSTESPRSSGSPVRPPLPGRRPHRVRDRP